MTQDVFHVNNYITSETIFRKHKGKKLPVSTLARKGLGSDHALPQNFKKLDKMKTIHFLSLIRELK